jgi:hypothetical protein
LLVELEECFGEEKGCSAVRKGDERVDLILRLKLPGRIAEGKIGATGRS